MQNNEIAVEELEKAQEQGVAEAEHSDTEELESAVEDVVEDVVELEEAVAEPEKAEEDKDSAKSWKDAYVRLAADFDNYRKRSSKEFDEVRRRERERVLGPWFEVYDNAERAIQSLPEKSGPWYQGFESLLAQMDKCLATFGIKAAQDMGTDFDPKRHEAIATLPNPALPNNTIMHIERRGFVYENGEMARIARVVVVKNPS